MESSRKSQGRPTPPHSSARAQASWRGRGAGWRAVGQPPQRLRTKSGSDYQGFTLGSLLCKPSPPILAWPADKQSQAEPSRRQCLDFSSLGQKVGTLPTEGTPRLTRRVRALALSAKCPTHPGESQHQRLWDSRQVICLSGLGFFTCKMGLFTVPSLEGN